MKNVTFVSLLPCDINYLFAKLGMYRSHEIWYAINKENEIQVRISHAVNQKQVDDLIM